MSHLQDINNLADLLQALKAESTPMFVNLCSRCENENYLMDQVVSNVQTEYGERLGYQKMPEMASRIIKQELMVSKNPVLLLIKNGEIKAVFGGMIAQHKLTQALLNLKTEIN
ncbi:MAG: hypothetical protein AAF985_03190 [Bacteroidota bacterium]